MHTPICSVCKQPVRLETAKADENGEAVHEDCYLQRLMASLQSGGRANRLIEQGRKLKEQADVLIAQSKQLVAKRPKLP